MVEGIEQIGPEFQHLIFKLPEMDREIALNTCVEVDLPRPKERIAPDIPRNSIRHHEMEGIVRFRRASSCAEKHAIVIVCPRGESNEAPIDS